MKALVLFLAAVAFIGCHVDDCGPNMPTGPCEIACHPQNCKPGSYCCAGAAQGGDDFGGCCLEGDTCRVDSDGPYCEGPTGPIEIISATRKARR